MDKENTLEKWMNGWYLHGHSAQMLKANNAGVQSTYERGVTEKRESWLSSREASALNKGLKPGALNL